MLAIPVGNIGTTASATASAPPSDAGRWKSDHAIHSAANGRSFPAQAVENGDEVLRIGAFARGRPVKLLMVMG